MQTKHFTLVGAVALCTALGAAETDSITTRSGVTYTNAVIQRADPDGVVIEYAPQPGSVGIAKLKFANLPDDLRKRYNYNTTDAQIFEHNQAAGNARRQEEIAQAETEKQRRHDDLVQKRADREAALEARLLEAAALAAAQTEMGGGGYGGYYGGDGYGIGGKRYRYDSRGPIHSHGGTADFSDGVPLSGLGTGWGDAGHFGPVNSQASRGPSRGAAPRGNSPGRSFSARSR